jgi:hypothetical protein
MNYCSLEDAYPMAPGQEYSQRTAKREERKKAKRCKGPALTFLESQEDKDPDRQNLERPKEIDAMNSRTGLRSHTPADAPLGMEPFQDVNFPDAGSGPGIEKQISRERISELLPRAEENEDEDRRLATIPTPNELMQAQAMPSIRAKGFFGADPDDDGFANYHPDAKNYLMEPTFTNAFTSLNNSAALPIPSVRDIWKPLTPTGVDTSFFKQLPAPGGEYSRTNGREANDQTYQSMSRKVDKILARLDELQRGPNPEQSQKEILLFVTSGVFVLFLMDLLVRKGSSLRFIRSF